MGHCIVNLFLQLNKVSIMLIITVSCNYVHDLFTILLLLLLLITCTFVLSKL